MSSFWKGKKVLITGINGFIGGNLAKKLDILGAEIFGLIRNKKPETFISYEKLLSKVTLIDGDLINKDLIARIISEEQINCVFHLAAQVEIGVGLKNPFLTFESNIKGTYSLLEAIRLFPDTVESVVIASSDKSYGSYEIDQMPYKEHYALKPIYPYDVSKACADMIARSYACEIYNLPIVVTRFSNIYGPGQLNFSAIMPDAIRSALGYSNFIPRGNGSQIRDYIFVEDVVDLYLLISEELSKNPEFYRGEIYNAGTNNPISVRKIIESIYGNIGNHKALEKIIKLMSEKKTIGEINCQFMDFEKVNKSFGWIPIHNFNDGLTKTINWYRKFFKEIY